MEQQEERDDEEKKDRKPRFTGEDIRDYSGEVERHQVAKVGRAVGKLGSTHLTLEG